MTSFNIFPFWYGGYNGKSCSAGEDDSAVRRVQAGAGSDSEEEVREEDGGGQG